MIKEQIIKDLAFVLEKLKIKTEKLVLEHPTESSFGDFSTNIALRSSHPDFANAVDLANKIVSTWRKAGLPSYLAKIEVAKPGFINLWIKNEFLVSQVEEVLKRKSRFGSLNFFRGKKILLEHTSPNPQTSIMLGHLRNNFLGMSVTNILEFCGARVTKDCIVNDRGIHVCRAIWGYLIFGFKKSGLKKEEILKFQEISDSRIRETITKVDWQSLLSLWLKEKMRWWRPEELRLKPDHANLIWYVFGSRAYEFEKMVQKQVEEILIAWEQEEKEVWQIWKQILAWSAKGYAQTYKRIGSIHDWVWYESEHYKEGKAIVEQGLKKKVFRESEGAVVTDLAKFGLSDTIVVKSDGTALYITQDLALVRLKTQKFPSDLYLWDVGVEQTLYFKQLFMICQQLGIVKKEKLFHLAYALINFKDGGKMSTRKGNVVKADEVLDELTTAALEIIHSTNQELRGKLSKEGLKKLAGKVALGAIKYSLLKINRETAISFDIKESLSLEGDSGPYLQYTYVRCRSVLQKAKKKNLAISKSVPIGTGKDILEEEKEILRTIYRFSEVVEEAAKNFSPNLLCAFLFDLAQKYNLFYNKLPILKSEKKARGLRLALTGATAQVLKNGLTLLGIETPEKM